MDPVERLMTVFAPSPSGVAIQKPPAVIQPIRLLGVVNQGEDFVQVSRSSDLIQMIVVIEASAR